MDKSEMTLVVLTSRYGKWQPGEVAGFGDSLAKRLIDGGSAELYDGGAGLGVVVTDEALAAAPPAEGDSDPGDEEQPDAKPSRASKPKPARGRGRGQASK